MVQNIDVSHSNTRIAKNTIVLYMRMLVLLFVGLFTSRVVLNALGVEDYGINNVVGGFIGLFAVVTQSMSSTISRYVTFALGKGDPKKLSTVFCTSVNIQVLYAAVVVLLAETIGLWFLNNKLVIPENRLYAANVLYQLSIASLVLGLISVPYNACIVAHEKMSAFAYITIYEAVGALAVAYILYLHLMDNLILYGLLTTVITWTQRGIYLWYCKKKFQECEFHLVFDKELFKHMFGFAGWNLIGASSAVLRDQGGNVLINLFFGPSVNAARGIAMSVNAKVTSFAGSFKTAMNPQITKTYASGDHEYMFRLIYQGARFSHFLMLFFALPIMMNTHYILDVWLGVVPEHTIYFVWLTMIYVMLESLSGPLLTAVKAQGNIKWYQIIVGGLQMLNLPIVYVCFKLGTPPETSLIVAIVVGHLTMLARALVAKNLLGLKPWDFLQHVYINVVIVSLVAGIIPAITLYFTNEGFFRLCITTTLSLISVPMSALYVGCDDSERAYIISKIKRVVYNKMSNK